MIKYKRGEIEILIENYNIDIIAMRRVGLMKKLKMLKFLFQVSHFLKDRSSCSHKKDGGVLLFIKDCIPAVSINHEVIGNNESVWGKVKN